MTFEILLEPRTFFYSAMLISLIAFITYTIQNTTTVLDNPVLTMLLGQYVIAFILATQFYFRRSKPQ